MAKVYYGCDEVTKGWQRYFALCNAHEVTEVSNTPSIQTLNTWRVDSPKGFGFILHAPTALSVELEALGARGEKMLSERALALLVEAEERASALAAKAILIQTSFQFMPSAATRSLMQSLAEAMDTKRVIMWEPAGMWDIESTFELAQTAGLTLVFDPFVAIEEGLQLSGPDLAFKVSERGGMRRNFDQYDFEDLMAQYERANRIFVLFRGRHKWRHARELQQVLAT